MMGILGGEKWLQNCRFEKALSKKGGKLASNSEDWRCGPQFPHARFPWKEGKLNMTVAVMWK